MCMNFVRSCVWQLFLMNKRWDVIIRTCFYIDRIKFDTLTQQNVAKNRRNLTSLRSAAVKSWKADRSRQLEKDCDELLAQPVVPICHFFIWLCIIEWTDDVVDLMPIITRRDQCCRSLRAFTISWILGINLEDFCQVILGFFTCTQALNDYEQF